MIRYAGPFGFIKPWTAVRDGKTNSQQFLTPSLVEGLRQKLEVSAILRHRLSYTGLNDQQEVTHTPAWNYAKRDRLYTRERAILVRGVLLQPELHLAFPSETDADTAFAQHICLARNEDVLLPVENLGAMDEGTFDAISGFELLFREGPDSFLVGYNRFQNGGPMYGQLYVSGNPIREA